MTQRLRHSDDAPSLRAIAARFAIEPPPDAIEPLGRGLINDTFSLNAGGRRYVLQRINGAVFPDPERIISNLRVLGEHLAGQVDAGLRLPALIATRDGAFSLRDAAGDCWRLIEFIPDTVTLERIVDDGQAREVGAVLGRFHRLTESLPCERLGLSLPDFHATPVYLQRLLTLTEQAGTTHDDDPDIRAGLDFVATRHGLAGVLDEAQRDGRLRLRATHGDPKLDNILFDDDGRAIALIDLDTVQPGLIQHDLADCLRSCCNQCGESADGDAVVRFDLALGGAILDGYAQEMRGLLTAADIDLLYDAIRLMPFELGLRFLTDHLAGDRYFRVSERGENLRKAGIQFALVADIERQEAAIRALIAATFDNPTPNRT